MKLRSGILGLTLSSVVALAAANAADIYVPGPGPAGPGGYKDCCGPSWAGFYVGVNGGYGWSADNHLLSFTNVGTFEGVNPAGGFGGGQIGYNWQGGFGSSHLVLGIEADIQGADIHDSGVSSLGRGTKYDLDWFGTVRGRLGYATGSALIYGTGGFAYGHINKRTFNGIPTDFKFDDTATGYSVGGGVEYMISPAWSFKVEYQYINLGRNDMFDNTGLNYATTRDLNTADDAFHTVRAGINYHIGAGYVPLK